MSIHPVIDAVTARIRTRSADSRAAYLARIDAARGRGPARGAISCGNLAHGFAAAGEDKPVLRGLRRPNLGIVTAFNDMLSAHQPFERYPALIKLAARNAGCTAQVAGGVPAMCDGVTQGQPGMELSLFSRDTIALATAVSLSHDMFDGAVMLGVCDKIVPGLLIGALSFGHLPVILVPAGPMPSGLANREKGAHPQALCGGQGKPRRTARRGVAVLSRPRHLHLLRHRQFQPDAHGSDGPAHAGRRVRQSEHAAARCPDRGGHGAGLRDHRARRALHADRPHGG
jgi:phosphogluconate dehydratase